MCLRRFCSSVFFDTGILRFTALLLCYWISALRTCMVI